MALILEASLRTEESAEHTHIQGDARPKSGLKYAEDEAGE